MNSKEIWGLYVIKLQLSFEYFFFLEFRNPLVVYFAKEVTRAFTRAIRNARMRMTINGI